MTFDFSKYEKPREEPEQENKPAPFDFSKYEKKQEPVTLKESAQAYGAGLAGGAGGGLGDIGSVGLGGIAGYLASKAGLKGTHEIAQELNPEGPKNALGRILQQGGEFGGLEGAIGTAAGGPIGGGLGVAHGTLGGIIYGAAKELGANDTVALFASLLTASPIAAERLISKLKVSKNTKDALKSAFAAEKKPPPPPGEPPPPAAPSAPPEVAGIGPGTVLPKEEGVRAAKEEIIGKLAEPVVPPKLGVEAKVAEVKGAAPTLQGRVSEAPELGEVISKEPFQTEAQAGREISKEVKAERDAEREIYREKYKEAQEITKTHEDIYPELAAENDRRISRLEELEKRSAAEEAVYQDALALRRMIGETDALIEANASRIMKQADSFSSKINYELPYAGAKGQIKDMVHQMNQAVISSLDRAGLPSELVRDADKTFSRFANRFMGDEISPYLQKKILNPEELAKTAVSNPGTYRAVKEAIGTRKSPLVGKIDRELTHKAMDKYYKNPELVNSKEYVQDLKNLSARVGKEKIADIDHFLRQRQLTHEKSLLAQRKIKEAQLSRENIPGKGPPTKISEKLSHEALAKSPEELDKIFKSVPEIRKLKRVMKDRGLSKEYEKLAEDKIREIFKEGAYGQKKLTGKDIVRIIDKKHEILEELLTKEGLDELHKIGVRAAEREVSEEFLKNLLSKGAKLGLHFLGLSKLVKILPI